MDVFIFDLASSFFVFVLGFFSPLVCFERNSCCVILSLIRRKHCKRKVNHIIPLKSKVSCNCWSMSKKKECFFEGQTLPPFSHAIQYVNPNPFAALKKISGGYLSDMKDEGTFFSTLCWQHRWSTLFKIQVRQCGFDCRWTHDSAFARPQCNVLSLRWVKRKKTQPPKFNRYLLSASIPSARVTGWVPCLMKVSSSSEHLPGFKLFAHLFTFLFIHLFFLLKAFYLHSQICLLFFQND